MTNRLNKLRTVLTHPVAKRLAVAAPISVGVGLLRAWFGGEHSTLIGLLVGVGSYIFAAWLLSTKSERKATSQQLTEFFQEHWRTVARGSIYILMCAYFYVFRSDPAEPAVKQILALVQVLGLVAVFIVPAIASWELSSSVAGIVSRVLRGLAFYSMALWLIGHGGDALYGWVLAHPNDAAICGASLAIVWMIVRFSAGSSSGAESIARSGMAAMAAGAVATKPTARDNLYTVAHEAGHALVYAALGGLPADVKMAVNDHDHGVPGFITSINSAHYLDEKSFAEWHMLVFLAGKVGESIMHGEATLGSRSDHLRWLEVARDYLANHYRGMYYTEPQNTFEQEQNEAKLEALQADQLAMLRTLFNLNAEVFKQLADTLLEKRTMGRDDLFPFLSQVKLPDGFPLPLGPFEKFATEWRNTDSSLLAVAHELRQIKGK